MGVLVAYSIGNNRMIRLGYAQETQIASAANSPRNELQEGQRFDIPAGPLETVLEAFQTITGIKVQFSNDAMRSISSPGVTGIFTVEQALQQILTGTGLAYNFTGAKTVTLELRSSTASVDINERESTLSSTKYTEPLRDIPQTITIIPRSIIEKQGATTLRDVLTNVPGLTMTAGEGGTPAGDNLTLRGFSARNDIFVDGVRDLGPQSRDPFNLEQVEIVKGPGSAYVGRGSTGGTINLISKSPGLRPAYGLTLNFGSDRTKRVTGDLNIPLEKIGFGEHAALRLNFMGHASRIPGREAVENERWGVAPSLALGLGTPTRMVFSYFKLKQDNTSDYGIPWVPVTNNVLVDYRDRPAPVPRNTFYGLKSRDFEKLDADLATVRFERDINEKMTLRNQFRFGRSTRDSMATPPRFASNNSTVINREMRSWITQDDIWDNQTDLRANFSTGSIEHAVVGGIALTRENNIRKTRTAVGMPTTLFNPNPNDLFPSPIILSPIVGDVTGKSAAVYVFDTAKLNEKWEVNGGVRWDYFDADGVSTTGAEVSRIDRMFSYRAGLVFKPKSIGSIYAAYGTSLNPSLEGLSYGTANTAIDPEKTNNFELGSKWDLLNQRLSVTGAVFHIAKTNARTPGLLPGEPLQVLQGEQRVAGVEFGASGRITRDWTIFGGYTFLDSKIVDSNIVAEVGKEIINTPRHSLSVWTTYRVWKIDLGGSTRYVGRRFGNNINTRFADGYWSIDAMASYPLRDNIDLRLNITNLTDKYYFDRLGGGHLIPGPARSVLLSTNFRF
jgi:catecholate siderophore receptor